MPAKTPTSEKPRLKSQSDEVRFSIHKYVNFRASYRGMNSITLTIAVITLAALIISQYVL